MSTLRERRLHLQVNVELEDEARPEDVTDSCRQYLESLGQRFEMSASTSERPALSVVIPVLDEEATLPKLYPRLTSALTPLEVPYELILVDDGSTDGTRKILQELCDQDSRVKYIRLTRNFGHQAALTAGLAHARGQAVVVMDGDLQDPPEVIPDLVARWQEGFEVVYAIRKQRKEQLAQRLAYALFYRLLHRVASMDIPLDAGDFCLMDQRVVEQLNGLPERNRFLRGLRSWVGFRQTGVEYERQAREAGRTKYDFWRLMGLALDGLVSFSYTPLRIATSLGFVVSFGSLVAGLYYLILRLTGSRDPVGFAAIVVSVLFLGGVQLVTIGIMGEYVGRIFDEVKKRPVYIIQEKRGLE